MRLRRKVFGLIKKIVLLVLLVVVGCGMIALGLFIPQLLGFLGIPQLYLRIIGFMIIVFTVVALIAIFETLEHL